MKQRWNLLVAEFARHLPYASVSTLIAIAAVWWFATQLINEGRTEQLLSQARASFHLFHPLHICLSAIATTSLFWRHDRRLLHALLTGSLGTIIPCGLSDYIFPYVGGRIMGQSMELHICIIDHPQLFFPFLGLGILAGF